VTINGDKRSGAEGRSFQWGGGEVIPVGQRGAHSSGAEGRSFQWGGGEVIPLGRSGKCKCAKVHDLLNRPCTSIGRLL